MWQALWQASRSLPLIDGKGLASFISVCKNGIFWIKLE